MSKNSSREEYNAYMRVYMLRRYHTRRDAAIKALGGKCVTCGSRENLELDHKNSKSKLFNIAKRLHTAPPTLLAIEMSKIQLLCRECHSLKSVYDVGNSSAKHGGVTMYVNHRCRCTSCREGNARRGREWKLRTGRVKVPRKPYGPRAAISNRETAL